MLTAGLGFIAGFSGLVLELNWFGWLVWALTLWVVILCGLALG